ncbi:complex I subunit 4 family protein [Amnibacterium endophyticum]|uniref:NuoM family protein n=1 Tax=Amnibacterium endophyticum TaxID=2109337 RepID=A0ABW4LG45_9MICO
MLSLIVLLPVVAAIVLAAAPVPTAAARWVWVGTAAADLLLLAVAALLARPDSNGLMLEEQVTWAPSAGTSYHLGVDGLSLPLLLLSDVLFLACAVWALRDDQRPRQQAALFLFLQTTCLGLFAAQDLLVFFLFFDLSIVGMYFVIAGWGHGDRRRSALTFFVYTFVGSLALLLGFIGLYLGSDPHTFDIVELTRNGVPNLGPVGAAVVLAAIFLGLAIKTPTVPFHTWLPPAHTDAPAIGSAILAGVLLKMGTYGFVRIAMPVLPDTWRAFAVPVLVVGIVSVLYGAFVAMAQHDLKRLIAYTSVNHMGYILVAVGAAGLAGSAEAKRLAVVGAVTQMVSHGLITGTLFLLAGVLFERRGTYAMDRFGGLAGPAPRYAGLFAVAVFGSLGLPALSGFIAEFQIFTGAIGATGWAAAALPGIVLMAALLLIAYQRLFTGDRADTAAFPDLPVRQTGTAAGLLALSLFIGLVPAPLLTLIGPAADGVIARLGG